MDSNGSSKCQANAQAPSSDTDRSKTEPRPDPTRNVGGRLPVDEGQRGKDVSSVGLGESDEERLRRREHELANELVDVNTEIGWHRSRVTRAQAAAKHHERRIDERLLDRARLSDALREIRAQRLAVPS